MNQNSTAQAEVVKTRLAEHMEVFQQVSQLTPVLVSAAEAVVRSLRGGGKLFLFGNGGSAADSQHLAAELVNRFRLDSPGYAAIALTTDTSALTAIANDSAYEEVFSRQLEALGRAGDVALGISTSGNSKNVLRGLEVARSRGLATIGLTGANGGRMAQLSDYLLAAPSRDTGRIQEVHIFAGHVLCELVEQALFEGQTGTTSSAPAVASEPAAFVHASSYVDAGAQVGAGTRIWHFSHVQKGARIGKKCSLGQNVNIDQDAIIGDNVKIQNNVSVYKGVEVEDDVFLGPSMVFTNVVNPRSHVSRRDEFKATKVGKGASIGANATVVCGHSIGEYAFIGAGAVVTRDVPPYALMTGNPARVRGWMCNCGVKLDLPVEGGGQEGRCKGCGRGYRLVGQKLTALEA